MRWACARARQSSLDTAVQRVTAGQANTVVAIGNANPGRGGGHVGPGPYQGFLQKLEMRARVYYVDEFRTSRACSDCQHALEAATIVGEWSS